MNNVDRQYLEILKDILVHGTLKHTRAGDTLSVFGRTMRFNLKEGLPLLTTKKVFYRGCIHELLWFLKGDTNIKYLVEQNVNIWTDDAYRWYKELVKHHNELVENMKDHEPFVITQKLPKYREYTRNEFLEQVSYQTPMFFYRNGYNDILSYTCGDLGDIYGKQWRSFGEKGVDQIKNIINSLKENPDDRRMICLAYNPDVLERVALPPCHIIFQFYTRELKNGKRELSCSFTMRSNDFCCGNPFNILQYALLVYMIAEVCDMELGELIYNGGDVHVYANHIEQAKEQLARNGSDAIPTLKFARKIDSINDFKYEDFIVENYNPDPPIKYPLNVG